MKEFIISENDSEQRLDKFIHKVCKLIPDSLIYKSIRTKKIKVNRKRCEAKMKLQKGDCVQCFLADHFFEENAQFVASQHSVDVVYEDENILIMYKPVGVLSQSNEAGNQDCMVLRMLTYLMKRGEFDPKIISSFRPALVHRLDRNSEGLLIAGKTSEALRELNRIMKEREIRKYYICIVEGILSTSSVNVSLYHMKDKNNKAVISKDEKSGYVNIRMQYRSLEEKGNRCLCEILLETGKSHQIRAGMAFLGYPLIGDVKYHGIQDQGYQALCAYKIQFMVKDTSCLSYLNAKKFTLSDSDVLSRWSNN